MILKYPYPFKSWFTVANDPDNTSINDWEELNSFIWKELKLPLSNSLFVESHNENLPDQVNLFDNPKIAEQYHDIIHTWGDYMHGRSKGFDREDAERAIEILKEHKIHPKVWIDHSSFPGNLMHNAKSGAIPETKDASGIRYQNFMYTLDLIKQIGINYIWDGTITGIVGQDRTFNSFEYFKNETGSYVKAIIKFTLFKSIRSQSLLKKLSITHPYNKQYFLHEFPDGNKFYCFNRYGNWLDADIYGLGKIISPKNIDLLLKEKGTMVAYTHLGKRPFSKGNETQHIPKKTKEALRYIQTKFHQKELMISPISEMLDYLVLRDNVKINLQANEIDFKPDGHRFYSISQKDLCNKTFSFQLGKMNVKDLKVISNNTILEFETRVEKDSEIYSITFN